MLNAEKRSSHSMPTLAGACGSSSAGVGTYLGNAGGFHLALRLQLPVKAPEPGVLLQLRSAAAILQRRRARDAECAALEGPCSRARAGGWRQGPLHFLMMTRMRMRRQWHVGRPTPAKPTATGHKILQDCSRLQEGVSYWREGLPT